MDEWLILLLLVPAIVVPVVMLVGFAGCDVVFGLDPVGPTVPAPIIESAVGQDDGTITVTWIYADPNATFDLKRTNPDQTTRTFPGVSSPYNDTDGLEPGKTYNYQVRAVLGDGETSDWSSPVQGTTFGPTFQATFVGDDTGWEGFCLVQRIEADRLYRSGTRVKLTLRASTVSDASIERVYISQPDPAGDKYDSAADLTAVISTSIVVPKGTAMTLPTVNYNLDEGQSLLIAVDFSAAPPSAIPHSVPVPFQEAVAYYRAGSEAALRDRSPNYTSIDWVYLIEKIEVA